MTAAAPEAPAVSTAGTADPTSVASADEETVLADVLVEEISIDGMCGVY